MEPFIQLTKETLDKSYGDFLSKKLVVWAQQKLHTWEIKQNIKSTLFVHGRALMLENSLTKRMQGPQLLVLPPLVISCVPELQALKSTERLHLKNKFLGSWSFRYVCLPPNIHFLKPSSLNRVSVEFASNCLQKKQILLCFVCNFKKFSCLNSSLSVDERSWRRGLVAIWQEVGECGPPCPAPPRGCPKQEDAVSFCFFSLSDILPFTHFLPRSSRSRVQGVPKVLWGVGAWRSGNYTAQRQVKHWFVYCKYKWIFIFSFLA